jgi:type II secretory ATPase GspE/PulE/Tfp pilus assembly ATPase PilB-like protein
MNRLKDLDVPPFLIASTLAAAISQRLVRRICPDCTESYQPTADLVAGTGLEGVQLTHGRGCDMCLGTGYRGRLGLFEILRASAAIREAFLQGASTDALWDLARREGTVVMKDAALEAVRAGKTTIEEVRRVLLPEDMEA